MAVMSDAAKELVQTVGVSGLNTVKDGKELRPHNPHNTLVYSMAKFTPEIQAAFNQTAVEFNQILPDGIPTAFKTVSIVELGFSGNVLREIYRIDGPKAPAHRVDSGHRRGYRPANLRAPRRRPGVCDTASRRRGVVLRPAGSRRPAR